MQQSPSYNELSLPLVCMYFVGMEFVGRMLCEQEAEKKETRRMGMKGHKGLEANKEMVKGCITWAQNVHSGLEKGVIAKGVFSLEESLESLKPLKFSRISRQWSDSPLFSTVWLFS